MGLRKKVSAEKKEVAIPQGSSGKPSENEIDLIFGKKKKRVVPENQETLTEDGIESGKRVKKSKPSIDREERKKVGKQSGSGKAGKSSSSAAAAAQAPPKPRKKTADGLTVYGEDELKWNSRDAGGTPLCPFDCECCF